MYKKIRKGFSLLEISIVIVVFALLALGVMQGGELVRKSKITSAQMLTKSSLIGKMDSLVLWLETTMPNSFDDTEEVDGGKISTWYDTSNTKITPVNALQANATNKPTYTTNAINGLPALKFISANSSYMSVASGFDNNADTVTLFLVWQPTTAAGAENDLLEKWAGSGPYPYALRSTTTYYSKSSDGTNNPGPNSTTSKRSGVPHIISARKIKSGAMNLWVNGSAEGGTVNDNTGTSFNNANLFIGCRGNLTQCTDGYIGEAIIFDRALSDQEIADIHRYLSKKWGITIS